jgi:hypothetical protein
MDAYETIRRFAAMMGIDPMGIRTERELGRNLTEEELKIIENEMKKVREGSGDPNEDSEGGGFREIPEGWDRTYTRYFHQEK